MNLAQCVTALFVDTIKDIMKKNDVGHAQTMILR